MAKENKRGPGKIHRPVINDDYVPVTMLLNEEVEVDSFICNWDLDDPQNAPLIYLADKPAVAKGNDLVGKRLFLKHWLCRKRRIPDHQNGGECDVVIVSLIAENGEVVSTMSQGILKSIELIRQQVGTGPLDGKMEFVIVGTRTGSGSDMLTLVPAMVADKE